MRGKRRICAAAWTAASLRLVIPAIEALVRFSRLASEARSPGEILPILAETATALLAADAAAVLQVAEGGRVTLVAGQNLPPELSSWKGDVETIGSELGRALLVTCDGRYGQAETILLIAGGDLYGVLVLFMEEPADASQRRLAEALADLAATALAKTLQFSELRRSNAELRTSRDALARSEKLRALGQMAAGVAHDIKNILNPLGLQIEVLRRRIARDPASAGEVLATMETALRTGVDTVERLRSFSRQDPERLIEPADLNRIVQQALEIARPQLALHAGIVLRQDLGSPPQVLIHAPELVTALVNLIVNALDAMGKAGSLTLATGAGNGGSWIDVRDDGPGMPPEVEQRVFEPFFTTKGERGTGLGLAMVYALVKRAAGQVTLKTAPGRGAHFHLWFPVHEPR